MNGEPDQRRDWIYTDFNPRPGWDKDQFIPVRYVLNRNYKLYDDGRFFKWPTDPLETHPLDSSALDPAALQLMNTFQSILDSIPVSSRN